MLKRVANLEETGLAERDWVVWKRLRTGLTMAEQWKEKEGRRGEGADPES